jgi:hypothetical protein
MRVQSMNAQYGRLLQTLNHPYLFEVQLRLGGSQVIRAWTGHDWVQVDLCAVQLARSCEFLPSRPNRWVVGILKTAKSGGLWNGFFINPRLPSVRLKLSCVGEVPKMAKSPSLGQRLILSVQSLKGALLRGLDAVGSLDRWSFQILKTLLSGDSRYVSPSVRQCLKDVYLWHLVVVSGMHVMVFWGLFLFVWKLVWLPMLFRYGLGVGVTGPLGWVIYPVLFVSWFGIAGSTLRGVAGFVSYCCLERGEGTRSGLLLKPLKWTASLLTFMVAVPSLWESLGFWMSVTACLGLGFVARGFASWGRLGKFWGVMTFMSFWMFPWMVYLNHTVFWPWVLMAPGVYAAGVVGWWVDLGLGVCGLGSQVFPLPLWTTRWMETWPDAWTGLGSISPGGLAWFYFGGCVLGWGCAGWEPLRRSDGN